MGPCLAAASLALALLSLLAGCSASSGARALSAAELNASADAQEARASRVSAAEAATLRESAAAQRSAARAIEERAQSMCAGVPEDERQRPSPFRAASLEGTRPLLAERRLIKTTIQELRGAELFVRPTPGLTKQWIARIVRCHLAWLDTVGPSASDWFEDPLKVGVPEIHVDETETDFVVVIRGQDKTEGEEILRRARLLAERH